MLLLVNARQHELVREGSVTGLRGSVGPTSAHGWTTVWLESDDATPLTHDRDFVVLVERPDGWELSLGSGRTTRLRLVPHAEPADVSAMAAALVATFGPRGGEEDVVGALAGQSDVDGVLSGLSRSLTWPAVDEPLPTKAVVLHRGDAAAVRMAASIAGPAWVLDTPEGWMVARPAADAPESWSALAAAMSAGDGRRAVTLALWRDGDASGYQVWRAGRPESAWDWGGAWRCLPEADLEDEGYAVSSLTARVRPDVDMPLVRALLRRAAPADPLGELVELLDLPGSSLAMLDARMGDAAAPRAELVERTSAPRAWLAAVRSAGRWEGTWRYRRLSAAIAVGTGLAAVVCVGMVVLGIAVLVSDGAVVDASAATAEDGATVVFFAVLSLVLGPLAVRRWRRSRPPRSAGRDSSSS